MKKFYAIAFAMLAAFSHASCGHDALDGDWEPMKWGKADYQVIVEDGTKYYYVPVDGTEFSFTCTNYRPWIANVKVIAGDKVEYIYPNDDFHSLDYESLHVKAVDRTVTVSFDPGDIDRPLRRYILAVTAGDVFGSFRFIQ